MNNKIGPAYDFPTNQQAMSVLIDGKAYGVCSEQEMKAALDYEEQRLKHFEPNIVEAELKKKIEEFRNSLGVVTLSWVYKQLTAEEIKNFENSYRFSGVARVWK
jgi:hypothetical protein